jgi:hypothetical protein
MRRRPGASRTPQTFRLRQHTAQLYRILQRPRGNARCRISTALNDPPIERLGCTTKRKAFRRSTPCAAAQPTCINDRRLRRAHETDGRRALGGAAPISGRRAIAPFSSRTLAAGVASGLLRGPANLQADCGLVLVAARIIESSGFTRTRCACKLTQSDRLSHSLGFGFLLVLFALSPAAALAEIPLA